MRYVEVMRKAPNRHVDAATPRPDSRYGRRRKGMNLSRFVAAVYAFWETSKARVT